VIKVTESVITSNDVKPATKFDLKQKEAPQSVEIGVTKVTDPDHHDINSDPMNDSGRDANEECDVQMGLRKDMLRCKRRRLMRQKKRRQVLWKLLLSGLAIDQVNMCEKHRLSGDEQKSSSRHQGHKNEKEREGEIVNRLSCGCRLTMFPELRQSVRKLNNGQVSLFRHNVKLSGTQPQIDGARCKQCRPIVAVNEKWSILGV
jgi:hypothetical protein